MIHFAPVTRDNYRECMRLGVADSQIRFVAPNAKSLAEAYVYYDTSRPFVIYCADQMVGFVLLRDLPDLGCYYISQFMIDQRYQRQGYGKQAMLLLIDMLKKEGRFPCIHLCFTESNEGAKRFYEGLGFTPFDVDADEIIMALKIR